MKEFVKWKKEWETGISKIDEQHKHFVSVLNKAYSINKGKNDRSKIEEVLDDLFEYARTHFSTEEELFNETEYPQAEEHIEKHGELLERVIKFGRLFENSKDLSKTVEEFLIFLRSWLDEHLIEIDHKYVPWMISHGVR